jgi:hypothetical protein
MKTYYLNNNGSKWRNFYTSKECGIGKPEEITLETKSGKTITRVIRCWKSFGNGAVALIFYKGKVIRIFADEILED